MQRTSSWSPSLALLVLAAAVMGWGCGPAGAVGSDPSLLDGDRQDAGPRPEVDAGHEEHPDAGHEEHADAGAGHPDAGHPDDAGVPPRDAGTVTVQDGGDGLGSTPGPIADGDAFSELHGICNVKATAPMTDVTVTVHTVNVNNGVSTPVTVKRCYHAYVPTTLASTAAAPVMFVLHGAGHSSLEMAAKTGMNTLADSAHFIVIYPDGHQQPSCGTSCSRGFGPGCCGVSEELPQDYDFLDQVAADLAVTGVTANGKSYPVDTKRLYLSGNSSGANMSLGLMCTRDNPFAAAAVESGTMSKFPVLFPNGPYATSSPVFFPDSTPYTLPGFYAASGVRCQPSRAQAVLMINGTGDNFMGLGNKSDPTSHYEASRPEMLNWLALMNHCTSQSVSNVTHQYGASNTDLVYDYSGCSSGVHTELFSVGGAGHGFWIANAGATFYGITTSRILWNFVSQYRAP